MFLCLAGIISFWLFSVPASFGLDRDRTITQLYHTAWTAKEGAPTDIRDLAQTSDGYLWMATPSGLFRFDGILFERYVPRSGILPSDNIYHLFASPDGGLWITYLYGKVSFLKDGDLTNYGEMEGLPMATVRIIAKDQDGTTWAAGAFGLARFEGQRWEKIGPEWKFPGKSALSFLVDKQGTIWVTTEDTIVLLPKGAISFELTGIHLGSVAQMVQAPDGTIWMAETSKAVSPMPPTPYNPVSIGPSLQVGSMNLLFDRDGALWVTTLGDGIRRVPFPDRIESHSIGQFSKEAEIFTEKDGLTADYSTGILEDREGNIWIGSSNGLDRFRVGNVVPVPFPPGYQAFGLAADRNGDILTGSLNRPAMRIHDETPIAVTGGVNAFESVSTDSDGAIWFGGPAIVFRLLGEHKSVIKTPKDVNVSSASSIFSDRNGMLWVYLNPEGLFNLKNGIWSRFDRQAELPKGASISGFLDQAGRKWFGFANNKLVKIEAESIKTFTQEDGLQVGGVRSVHGRSQNIWVGGEHGIAGFIENQFHMVLADGSDPFRGVYGIVETLDGSLWFSEKRGIVNIPVEEIHRFLENPSYRVQYNIFDYSDGLPGRLQVDNPSPRVIEGADGKVWFATNNGVAWVDPKNLVKNLTPPPLSIRSLTADEQTYYPSADLQLPKGTSGFRVDYTALSLAMPERVRFRYRLEGANENWQEAGTRREAFYTNLGPGSYRFRVIAANGDGVWNNEGAVLEFKILPVFYQTYWFLLLCLAVLVCLIWATYRFRIRQLNMRMQMQFDERLSERTRIARNLHDTLLQGVVSAAMQLDVISQEIPDSLPAKPRLSNINALMGRVINDGRDAVQELRSSAINDAVNLEERFSQAKHELDPQGTVDFRITVTGTPKLLLSPIADEVHQICKEALTNAFRHAHATRIEIEIEYAVRFLCISIVDNGCGIEPEVLSFGREGHWGLSGMRERAAKIGADIEVRNRSEGGTEVKMSLPNRFAYEPSNRIYNRLKDLLHFT